MKNLNVTDDKFIDEYIISHRNDLGKSNIGGTDWRFADFIAPAFREILEISKPNVVLEIGFNIGASAHLFLSIDPHLFYHSIDVVKNEKSVKYLSSRYKYRWTFFLMNSKNIKPGDRLLPRYDLIFLDGDHSYDGVINDIEKALLFSPEYILFDDIDHPSHSYIRKIIEETYSLRLGIIKEYNFDQLWKGYSMALCKVKNKI